MPQIFGWLYFSLIALQLCNEHNVYLMPLGRSFITSILLFFVALIGITSFGYLFNDWCDIKSDIISGKKNSLAFRSPVARLAVIIISLAIGITAWFFLQLELNHSLVHPSNILFVLQILLLVIYSLPPVRLKERAELGTVADTIYGHLNPVFITLTSFFPFECWGQWNTFFLSVLFLVCCTKGLRNILLHQLSDRKKDKLANIQTTSSKFGPISVINFINIFLIPIEGIFLFALIIVISAKIPPLIISFFIFVVLSYLKFSGWKLIYLPKRQLKFKFFYFLNDYYEGWVPIFFLVILSALKSTFLFLLILHLIVFPSFIIKLWKDFKIIRENFKTEEDY